MIRSSDAGVMLSGTTQEIMADFVMIVRSLRSVLAEECSEEVADRTIADLGKIAFLDPSDDKSFDEIIDESPFLERRKKHDDNKEAK